MGAMADDVDGGPQCNTSACSAPLETKRTHVDLKVHGVRAFIASCFLMVLLAIATYSMIKGFTIATLDASTLTDDTKTDLIDTYNTYSGSIATFVSMPFQQFVLMLLPVFVLCFAPKAILSQNKSFVEQWGPVLGAVTVSWLLNQGINAVNVQFGSPIVELVISVDDLAASDPNSAFDLAMSDVTSTSKVAGNPSNNTILRSAIHSVYRSFDSSCALDSMNLNTKAEASIRYGFPSNSWLQNILPESVAADKTLSFSMSDSFTTGSKSSSEFPGGDINKTAVIFNYGFRAIWLQFGAETSVGNVYGDIASSDPATMLNNMKTKIENVSPEYLNMDASWKEAAPWENVSLSEIAIEFSNTRLSPQVLFETVTFTLPLKMQTMKDWLEQPNVTDLYYDLSTYPNCNDYANQQHGRYNELAQGCAYVSNSSVLISSVARHIAVDEVKLNVSSEYSELMMKNPRLVYRVTIGRLSWKTNDLAQVYGAECAPQVNCDGLYFPLSDVKQHLVVGKEHLPLLKINLHAWAYGNWQVLAIANRVIESTTQADIIYPPNYALADGSPEWSTLNGAGCSSVQSDYINDIMYRHIYSKDLLQAAYTAGMFWLFQNAAVKNVEAMHIKNPQGTADPLAFAGNRVWISPRVSIPTKSAYITFGGCAIVVLMGTLLIGWSNSSKRNSALSAQLSAHNAAEVLVNTKQYPPLFIQSTVQSEIDGNTTESSAKAVRAETNESFREFIITALQLQHYSSDPARIVVIGGEDILPLDEVERDP